MVGESAYRRVCRPGVRCGDIGDFGFRGGSVADPSFFASFANKKSYWKLGRFDFICGFCSVAALVFWIVSAGPIIPIMFAMLGDFFALVPTLIKSWRYPHTESGVAYVTGLIGALTSFTVIDIGSFSSCAFPFYLMINNLILVLFVYRGKLLRRT